MYRGLSSPLTYQRDTFRGGHALSHQQLEHSERQQHCDTKRDLFTRVCWQVEAQRSQKRDHHAGDEQVKDVEGGTSLQVEGEGDVWVRIWTAAVQDDVLLRWHAQNLVRRTIRFVSEKSIEELAFHNVTTHLPFNIGDKVSQVSTV